MTTDQLAILMPTRNRPAILRRTLEELLRAGFGNHPLLIYDDASDDAKAVAEVASLWPGERRLLRSDTRTGQAKGRNALMRASTSEYALFLDDDCWPENRDAIIKALELARTDGLAVATFHYRSLADGSLSIPPDQGRAKAKSFLGGASLFHVPTVLGVGGYRDCFVYGYEEPELTMRLWLAGKRTEYLPGIVIVHNQFCTPEENRDYQEYDYLYARNGILMSSLNMPCWFGLPHGLLRSVRRSAYQRRNFRAKMSGTLSGVWLSLSLWRERKPSSIRQVMEWFRFSRNAPG
jgi:GT2 family glycosyltransferase